MSAAAAAGRRPGNADTRGEIVEAAKRVFAAKGYDGASLRAVAREAQVDPALVHHYFDGKASLFIAAMALPFDPRTVQTGQADPASTSTSIPTSSPGVMVVAGFLTMWDHAEGTGSSFAACVAGMAASASVADAMREFVAERV
jgi:AcrR family transcriptional regulator